MIHFIVALPIAVYLILLLWFIVSFIRVKRLETRGMNGITVLIPFKNEAKALPNILESLAKQDSYGISIDILLINDHSDDTWNDAVLGVDSEYKILTPPTGIAGKKACMRWGVNQAKHEWVLTLDVDVKLPKEFFAKFEKGLAKEAKYFLIPLTPQPTRGFVSAFFDLEFLALHFVGLASASGGKPLLSNAACCLFEKEAFVKSAPTRTDWNIPSGDDVFTMFAISQMFGRSAIARMPWDGEQVVVSFPKGIRKLWSQRLRWVGKSGAIKNTWFSFVSIITFVFNITVGILSAIFLVGDLHFATIVVFTVALIVQISFLCWLSNKWERRDLFAWIIPSVLIYPVYLLALVITQYFWKPKWK